MKIPVCMKWIVCGIALYLPAVTGFGQSSVCQSVGWRYYVISKCQAYPGEARPKQDVAILKLKKIGVISVNGLATRVCYAATKDKSRLMCSDAGDTESIELLPGTYSVQFFPVDGNTQKTEIVDITVEAGKTYTAHGTYSTTGCAQTSRDTYHIYYQCWGTWGVEVYEDHAK